MNRQYWDEDLEDEIDNFIKSYDLVSLDAIGFILAGYVKKINNFKEECQYGKELEGVAKRGGY
jgi:hypothetical protein